MVWGGRVGCARNPEDLRLVLGMLPGAPDLPERL